MCVGLLVFRLPVGSVGCPVHSSHCAAHGGMCVVHPPACSRFHRLLHMARVTASQRDVYPSAVLFFILPYLFCDGRITPPLIGCLPPYLLTPHPCPILQTPATEPMLSLFPLPLSPSLSLPSSFSLSLSAYLPVPGFTRLRIIRSWRDPSWIKTTRCVPKHSSVQFLVCYTHSFVCPAFLIHHTRRIIRACMCCITV